jgi:hypothetical protein
MECTDKCLFIGSSMEFEEIYGDVKEKPFFLLHFSQDY